MSTLRTHNLTKPYGGRTVVGGVSLDVSSGEIVGLLGPNGAGKTTTFYMTVGLTAPDSGRVELDGDLASSEAYFVAFVGRAEDGTDYVDANLTDTDDFMMGFQHLLTERAWGYAWSRPGLDRKTRSMLNLAILTALGRPDELGIYVKGAIATGVSADEIKEILIHATVYCGTPAGRQAFRAAHEALLAEGVLRRPS